MSKLTRDLRRMIAGLTLERFEERTEWPLAVVAVIFLAAYSVQVLVRPAAGHLHTAMDFVVGIAWTVFIVDYLVRLALATNRPRWFAYHLIDLALVVLPFLRPLRLLRLVVLVAALQRAIGGAVRGRVVVYTAFSAVLLLYAGSLAILDYEGGPGSKINGFADALWWSISTVVGYSAESPVTAAGRAIAILLVIGGIGLVGSVTATLASWIVQRVAEEDSEQQAATAAHIEALHEDVRLQMLQMGNLRDEIQHLKEVVSSQQPPQATHNGHSVDAVGPFRIALTLIARLQAMTLRWSEGKRMRPDEGTTG